MTATNKVEEEPVHRNEQEDSDDENGTRRPGSFRVLADPKTSFRTRRNMWDKRAANHTPEGLRPSDAARASTDSSEKEERQYHYVPTDDPQFNALLQARKGVELPSEESRHHKYVPTDDPSFNALQKKGGKGDYSHLRRHHYVPQVESRRRPPTVFEDSSATNELTDVDSSLGASAEDPAETEETDRTVISDADAGGGPSFSEPVSTDETDDETRQGIDPEAAKAAFRGKVFRPSCKHESFDQTQEYWEEAAKEKTPDGISPEMASVAHDFSPSIHGDAKTIIEEEDLDLKPGPTPPDLDGDETPLAEPQDDDDDDSVHEYKADELHTADELDEVLESASHDSGSGQRERVGLTKEDSVSTASTLQGMSVGGPEAVEGDIHTSVSSFGGNSLELSPPRSGLGERLAAFTTTSLVSRAVPVDEIPPGASPLPDPSTITNGGPILARSSLRSLVLKRWQPAYWIRAGPSSLYVFRSREDFEDWLLNPKHTQKQRDYLVKVRLDFAEDFGRKSNLRGYRMTALKLKAYDKRGKLYQFKLEKWSDLGVNIAVAFAAQEKTHAEVLRNELNACLANCPNGGLNGIDDLIVQGQR